MDNFESALAVPRALGLEPNAASLFSAALSSSTASQFLPRQIQQTLVQAGLAVGRQLLLSDWLLNPSNPVGRERLAAVQRSLEEGKSLQLLFPQHDLGFRYSRDNSDSSQKRFWAHPLFILLPSSAPSTPTQSPSLVQEGRSISTPSDAREAATYDASTPSHPSSSLPTPPLRYKKGALSLSPSDTHAAAEYDREAHAASSTSFSPSTLPGARLPHRQGHHTPSRIPYWTFNLFNRPLSSRFHHPHSPPPSRPPHSPLARLLSPRTLPHSPPPPPRPPRPPPLLLSPLPSLLAPLGLCIDPASTEGGGGNRVTGKADGAGGFNSTRPRQQHGDISDSAGIGEAASAAEGREERGEWLTWLAGVGESGAVLVRPDGHVAWRMKHPPADGFGCGAAGFGTGAAGFGSGAAGTGSGANGTSSGANETGSGAAGNGSNADGIARGAAESCDGGLAHESMSEAADAIARALQWSDRFSPPGGSSSLNSAEPTDVRTAGGSEWVFNESRVVKVSSTPRVYVYKQLLSPDDCAFLVAMAKPKIARQRRFNATYLRKYQNPRLRAIEDRIASFLFLHRVPQDRTQVRFNEGQAYDVHLEFYRDNVDTQRSGHRVATLVLFPLRCTKGRRSELPSGR
ncbi:unnamed protein product, partial [Closterium sp. Yama58-4]